MSLNNSRISGFSIVELVIVVVVIGVIGVLGYVAYDRIDVNNKDNTSKVEEQSPVATDVDETAPVIKKVSDLSAAKAALVKIDTSSSGDSAELDSQLAGF